MSRRVFLTTSGTLAVGVFGAGALVAWPASAEPDTDDPGDPADPGDVDATALLTGDPTLCGSRDDRGARDYLWTQVKFATVLVPGVRNILVAHPDKSSFPYALASGGAGKYNLLVIPTRRIKGIECPTIVEPGATNLWKYGWQQAQSHISGADIVLGINSRRGRKQDQLHIHLSSLTPAARKDLDALKGVPTDPAKWNANIHPVTTNHGEVFNYRIMKVNSLEQNPFNLLHDHVAHSDMFAQMLAVTSAPGGGYYLLASQGKPEETADANHKPDIHVNNLYGTAAVDPLFNLG